MDYNFDFFLSFFLLNVFHYELTGRPVEHLALCMFAHLLHWGSPELHRRPHPAPRNDPRHLSCRIFEINHKVLSPQVIYIGYLI